MAPSAEEQRLQTVLAVRSRTIRWGVLTAFVAAVAVFSALVQGGQDPRERLLGLAAGLAAWVACTGVANALAGPLLSRGWSAERAQLVTSATLGALQGLAAALIGSVVGASVGLAAGAGWLAAGALATVVGLLQWLASLARTDELGARARHEAATAPPAPLPQQTAVWFLLGVTFAVWVGVAADGVPMALAAAAVQAALLAAIAFALQRRAAA